MSWTQGEPIYACKSKAVLDSITAVTGRIGNPSATNDMNDLRNGRFRPSLDLRNSPFWRFLESLLPLTVPCPFSVREHETRDWDGIYTALEPGKSSGCPVIYLMVVPPRLTRQASFTRMDLHPIQEMAKSYLKTEQSKHGNLILCVLMTTHD